MIAKARFNEINNEVKESLEEVLDNLRILNQGKYALFLADGEYKKEYDKPGIKTNPNLIDYRIDGYLDASRLKFLGKFLNISYSFLDSQVFIGDDEQRFHLELMIYTHIWEAKPFLKKLYRLAHLINGEEYVWNVKFSDKKQSKHIFIRESIRDVFKKNANNLAQVMTKGFHTSLRNAFAHSEYYFDTMNGNKRIILTNYDGDATWELDQISFDEWSERFLYSALLSYYLWDLAHIRRSMIIEATGTDRFEIKHPTKKKVLIPRWIKYVKEHDNFISDD